MCWLALLDSTAVILSNNSVPSIYVCPHIFAAANGCSGRATRCRHA